VRAAVYARQSKDRLQGIAAQIADCAALCGLRGWEVTVKITDNDVSASDGKKRPGYEHLLRMVERREIDVIVVSHIDRLLRSMVDLEMLINLIQKHDVGLVTVIGDLDLSHDMGRLLGRILAAVARGEVERKSARQKRGEWQRAEQGKARRGTPQPFGWLPDRITADPAEASAVMDGCRAILAGATLLSVAREWDRRGLRPHQAPYGPLRKNAWTRTSVKEILANPRVAGIGVYKGAEVATGEWETLVPEEMWRPVAEIIRTPRFSRTARGLSLLGGLAYCRCGNYVTGGSSCAGHPSYRCNLETRDYRPGPHVNLKRDGPDAAVTALVIARLSRPDAIHLLTPQDEGDVTALRDEELVLRARLATLSHLYIDGKISEADLTGGRARGEERLTAIAGALAGLGRESVLAPIIMAEDPESIWETLTLDRRRAVVDTLMTVTLHPSGRGARRFDPDKVLPAGRGIVWKQP
jgi:DNA invertase Pin-like site-specific DNA recombinase